MPLLHPTTGRWEGPITLTADEIWQSRGEALVFISTSLAPAPKDGIALPTRWGLHLKAGTVIRYRRGRGFAGAGLARIAREQI